MINEIIVSIFTFFIFVLIFVLIEKTLDKNGSDVRIIWFFYFLSFCVTLVLAIAAKKYGAIDEKGKFHGAFGDFLEIALTSALGVEGSVNFAAAIVFVLVIPQVLSYLFSGVNGFGSKQIFVKEIFYGFVWWVVKTLVVASGVMCMISIFAYIDEWPKWNREKAIANIFLSTFVLAISFCFISMYRVPVTPGDPAKIKKYKWIRKVRIFLNKNIRIIWRMHLWLTRRS